MNKVGQKIRNRQEGCDNIDIERRVDLAALCKTDQSEDEKENVDNVEIESQS